MVIDTVQVSTICLHTCAVMLMPHVSCIVIDALDLIHKNYERLPEVLTKFVLSS